MTTAGAELTEHGVQYCVWAPGIPLITVDVEPAGKAEPRHITLQQGEDGYHQGVDADGRAGDAYSFRLPDDRLLPDPNSRGQRDGVHGRSLVIDPKAYAWHDMEWIRPPFRDLIIYELHVGAFTPEGTFNAAREKLPHLAELGVNAIEIMPIADFPGQRNWGYDGVLIYAPARCYGSPDDLRALVDAAHGMGIAVLLDVVYNHFGPDGNYLSAYSPYYFCKNHFTPWGDGFNFDASQCEPVRRFFLGNPTYWMEEFHIDGFRFDATHEIRDDSGPHILAEMTASIHARGGYVVAEDARNDARVISPAGLGFDAVWADDFHHAVRVSQTGERFSYFLDFAGTAEEVADALRHGWIYRGQPSPFQKKIRGTECRQMPPQRFIHCLSNHDQTGNRALGERLHHLVTPQAWRALSVLLCLTPYTPMLFMGQEWSASSPFLFFTDHHAELGRKITLGRRREFAHFPGFSDTRRVPDPQAEETFLKSRLNWQELHESTHAGILALYRECLKLRRENKVFRPEDRQSWNVSLAVPGKEVLLLTNAEFSLLINLHAKAAVPWAAKSEMVLSSEEARFGGCGTSSWDAAKQQVSFTGPEAVLFRTAVK